MSVGSPTAGTWSSSQWRPDNEFETDTKYRVANWAAYNQALVRRGDVTVWLSSEAITACPPPRRLGRRGGQWRYSDLPIETALTLRLLYHLPLPRLLAHQGALVGAGGLTGKRHRRPRSGAGSRVARARVGRGPRLGQDPFAERPHLRPLPRRAH